MKITTLSKCLSFYVLQLTTKLTEGQPANIKVTAVNYTDDDDFLLQGFKSVPDDSTGKVPAVIIIPDWNGVNTYEQQRATMLASDLGYVGFAADIYGINDHVVVGSDRGTLATKYLSDVPLFVQRIRAAVNLVKTFDEVDPERVAIIGYCFGGTGVMDYALTGQYNVVALVSFHGGLSYIPAPVTEITPKLLILSGGDDDTSSDIIDLENTLSVSKGNWEITRYSDIQHAFTVFSDDRYNEWADTRSWHSMSIFLSEAFGITAYSANEPSVPDVENVNYTDVDDTSLVGYLALPDAANVALPAVIILPDWDGVNTYEKKRATMLAESGYVAFAADIYGADLQEGLSFDQRMEQATKYRSDPSLFTQRIQRAVDYVLTLPQVDKENVAMIGYCFGGTGVFEYVYTGSKDIKVAVSFHGGHQNLPRPPADITPYVIVLSGGIDDAHGNQTEMESSLNGRDASWEITRYAKVGHGFTSWTSGNYDLTADARSWESMMTSFASLIPVPSSATDAPTRAPIAAGTTSGAVYGNQVALIIGILATVTGYLVI